MYRRCPVCSAPVTPADFFKSAFTINSGPITCHQYNSAISRPWRELGTGVAGGAASAILLVALFESLSSSHASILEQLIVFVGMSLLFLLMACTIAYYAFQLSPIKRKSTEVDRLSIEPRRLIHLLLVVIVAGILQTLFSTHLTTVFFAIGITLSEALLINRKVWPAQILPLTCYAIGLAVVPWDEVHSYFSDAEKSKQFCESMQSGTTRSDVIRNAEASRMTYTEKTPHLLAVISSGDGPSNCYVYYLNGQVLRTVQRTRR